MKKFPSIFLVCLALAGLAACGKKGPLLPPLVHVPQKIETVSLYQRGTAIVLEWTNPSAMIDGRPLRGVSEVEIWSLEKPKPLPGESPSVTPEDFKKAAQMTLSLKQDDFAAHLKSKDRTKTPSELRAEIPVPPDKLDKTLFVFALRIRDLRRRPSEFSAPLLWEPLQMPLPPRSVAARMFEDRIEIQWEPSAANVDPTAPAVFKGYNVYRSEGDGPPVLLNQGLVQGAQFDDKDFAQGKTYRYIVRAAISDAAPFSESADSSAAEVTVKDVFPPAAPSGLKAIATSGIILLAWDANAEKDLAGYKVWRREEGKAALVLLTPQPVTETTYSDRTVEKNRRYEYAITAVDRAGNESSRSAAASETAREGER